MMNYSCNLCSSGVTNFVTSSQYAIYCPYEYYTTFQALVCCGSNDPRNLYWVHLYLSRVIRVELLSILSTCEKMREIDTYHVTWTNMVTWECRQWQAGDISAILLAVNGNELN